MNVEVTDTWEKPTQKREMGEWGRQGWGTFEQRRD
jgi:hypothetical protein